METGKHGEQRGLACRELHQRMRLSFRRRRYICGGNQRKQQKVRLFKPRRKRPKIEETEIRALNLKGLDKHILIKPNRSPGGGGEEGLNLNETSSEEKGTAKHSKTCSMSE